MRNIAIAVIATLILISNPTTAQVKKRTYDYKCADKKATITWTENNLADRTVIDISYDWQSTHQEILNKDRTNVMWHIKNTDSESDYTVRLEGSTYKVSGKIKGKSVSKTYQSKGLPWYECMGYSAQYIFKDGIKSIKCESINPTNGVPTSMTATISDDIVVINGKKARTVTLSAAAGLWKCYYYVNPDTKEFIQYRGCEGFHVPETVWTIK